MFLSASLDCSPPLWPSCYIHKRYFYYKKHVAHTLAKTHQLTCSGMNQNSLCKIGCWWYYALTWLVPITINAISLQVLARLQLYQDFGNYNNIRTGIQTKLHLFTMPPLPLSYKSPSVSFFAKYINQMHVLLWPQMRPPLASLLGSSIIAISNMNAL